MSRIHFSPGESQAVSGSRERRLSHGAEDGGGGARGRRAEAQAGRGAAGGARAQVAGDRASQVSVLAVCRLWSPSTYTVDM